MGAGWGLFSEGGWGSVLCGGRLFSAGGRAGSVEEAVMSKFTSCSSRCQSTTNVVPCSGAAAVVSAGVGCTHV